MVALPYTCFEGFMAVCHMGLSQLDEYNRKMFFRSLLQRRNHIEYFNTFVSFNKFLASAGLVYTALSLVENSCFKNEFIL